MIIIDLIKKEKKLRYLLT